MLYVFLVRTFLCTPLRWNGRGTRLRVLILSYQSVNPLSFCHHHLTVIWQDFFISSGVSHDKSIFTPTLSPKTFNFDLAISIGLIVELFSLNISRIPKRIKGYFCLFFYGLAHAEYNNNNDFKKLNDGGHHENLFNNPIYPLPYWGGIRLCQQI